MKTKALLIIFFIFSIKISYSQDIIYLKDGSEIESKVTELTTESIKYKNFNQLKGPLRNVLIEDVYMIIYENGTREIIKVEGTKKISVQGKSQNTYLSSYSEKINGSKEMSDQNNTTTSIQTSNYDMRIRGKQDASIYYNGKNSGAAWTSATTILASPLLGLVPALACGTSEPLDENLNYPDPKLMMDYNYSQSYKQEAHKKKRKKIWRNFGYGSAVWILIILIAGSGS